jgi:phosphoribosylanthranilate isomerase
VTAVKFCGFTREEDVREAVRLGADYLGLNLVAVSPRRLTPAAAAQLAEAAHDEAVRGGFRHPLLVGVLTGSCTAAATAARACGLDAVQWHGIGEDWVLADVGLPLIAAVRPRPGEPANLPDGAWAYLVDAHDPVLLGGTGRLADWEAAAGLASRQRVFLAGGLSPDNVAAAVLKVQPFAVDVASGIEAAPGVKDHARMRAFIEQVRRADGRANDTRS